MKWALPFEEGVLEAKAAKDGKETSCWIVTHHEPTGIFLDVDRASLKADGYDAAHVVALLIDEEGNPILTDERTVEFEVRGDCRILGVDNGAADNVQDFRSNRLLTHKGRCMMIVQSNRKEGNIEITAISGEITSEPVSIEITRN
jgi:hypothetical protein